MPSLTNSFFLLFLVKKKNSISINEHFDFWLNNHDTHSQIVNERVINIVMVHDLYFSEVISLNFVLFFRRFEMSNNEFIVVIWNTIFLFVFFG